MSGIFDELARLPRWVPYRLVWNPKREKFDKIPHNGRHNLHTTTPTDWLTFPEAWECAQGHGLSGVGFVFTGGVELDGWTLFGFDVDGVDFENYKPPFKTYSEKSPSGEGIHTLFWVPTPWAKLYRNTAVKYPHCEHIDCYFDPSARFLTVTFDNLNDEPIAQLQAADLKKLESLGLNPAERAENMKGGWLSVVGQAVNLRLYDLTPEQTHLVNGTGNVDRSAVLHGLIIKLLDARVSAEDVLATVLKNDALQAYFLSHRNNSAERAQQFAKEEIEKAFAKSKAGLTSKLADYNIGWKEKDTKPVELPKENKFPIELYEDAPGLVGEIAHWICKASYTPRPEFAYAAAVSMMACLIGPYCTSGPKRGKLNLYFALVGGTGTGKNESIDPMGLLLSNTDGKDCIMDFPASEAALRRQLNSSNNILIRADELAHKLDSMKDNSNGSLLGKAILEMYNGARLPPKAYADERKCLPAVENPFVQIIGGTTEKIWEVVKMGHMEDGTLNRFIFVSLPEKPEYSRNHNPDPSVDKKLKDKLNAFWQQGRMYDMIGRPDMGRHVEYAPDVSAALEELDISLWPTQQKKFGALYTRFTQNMMKIATIVAVGRGAKVVEMQDFDHAYKFMDWSVSATCAKAKIHIAENNYGKMSKRLVRKLVKVGGKMRMRDAYRFLTATRREIEEIIATLVLSDTINVITNIPNQNGTTSDWIILADDGGLGEDESEDD